MCRKRPEETGIAQANLSLSLVTVSNRGIFHDVGVVIVIELKKTPFMNVGVAAVAAAWGSSLSQISILTKP